ncbi:MAG: hypothetical protein E5X35_11535 [Mesorhizobium sp.]|uniref:hypothetical protein n=1 Tax=Mesorhizobium sp. TaxID=1871066 RepID=UPI001217F831|nr:hypothetical protein [Mesorhizobium sp.]TIR33291.1 MAG: hypothetical protein E5X35_11535 [Mesorhizobium sp.]
MLAMEPKSYDAIFGDAWHVQGSAIRKRFTYLEVEGAPTGVITPEFIGQSAYDTVAQEFYTAVGLTSADWVRQGLSELIGAAGQLVLAAETGSTVGAITGKFRSKAHVEASTIDASIDRLETFFFAPGVLANSKVGGAHYVRMSKADIDAAGYPAQSYIRSLDRNMPGGAPADDTNGGYWVLDADEPQPQMLGLINDAAALDQTAIFQAWLDLCGILAKPAIVKVPAHIKTTDTVTFPANLACDLTELSITYTGTKDRKVLYIQSANTKILKFGTVQGDTISWASADYYGIYLRDVVNCRITLRLTRRFTVGYALIGSVDTGTAYNTIYPGVLRDNKYCEQLRSLTAGGFINENTFIKGNYGNTSAANASGVAYGTHLIADPGAYNGHNDNRWIDPNYEMAGGVGSGSVDRIPIFYEGAGGFNNVLNARVEGAQGPIAVFNGSNVRDNDIGVSFLTAANAGQINAISEVNGANGNRLTGRAMTEVRASYRGLRRLLSSNGGADVPYVRGDVFLMESTSSVAKRSTTIANRLLSNADALELSSATAVMFAVDTTKIKQWRFVAGALNGFTASVLVIAFDSTGARLTGDAVDVLGNEKYVKNSSGSWAATANFGGAYTATSFSVGNFSVRAEVATMWIGLVGAPVRSMELIGFATSETAANVAGVSTVSTFVPLDDDGSVPLATANPSTAGTHGYYSRGHVVYNSGATSGQPMGWQCTTAGWLAKPWVPSTVYSVPGRIVINDTGKAYKLITAGTSAGAGGPTGTGTGITDGTGCVWDYVGPQAVFSALANLA